MHPFIFLIPFALFIPLFAFISVAVWSDHRTRERAAFYRSEVLKKIADSSAPQALQVAELMREQEHSVDRRRREGMKLGGLVSALVGLGLLLMLSILVPNRPVWAVGFIPLSAGVALLVYCYAMAPRLSEARVGPPPSPGSGPETEG